MRILLFVFIVLLSGPAFADCSNPSSTAGGMDYSSGTGVRTICDGANWLTYEQVQYGSGGARLALNIGEDPAACALAKVGRLRYTSSSDLWQYCDGANWLDLASGGGAVRRRAATARCSSTAAAAFAADFTFVYTSCRRSGARHSYAIRRLAHADIPELHKRAIQGRARCLVSMSGAAGGSATAVVGVGSLAITSTTGTAWPDANAFYADARTTDDATAQSAEGLTTHVRTFANDIGYGVWIDDDNNFHGRHAVWFVHQG